MSHRIVFAHSKGGTGKTTACVNTAGFLERHGKRVLVVDADPSANATMHLGLDPDRMEHTLHDVLLNARNANVDSVMQCVYPSRHNIDVIPGDQTLHDTFNMLYDRDGRHESMDMALDAIDDWYDYILIDTPASQLNAIAGGIRAADAFYLVMDHSQFARDGAHSLRKFLKRLPDRHSLSVNPNKVLLVENRQDGPIRRALNKVFSLDATARAEHRARSLFGTRLHTIPYVHEALSSQEQSTPLSHMPTVPKGAKAFEALADEIVQYY